MLLKFLRKFVNRVVGYDYVDLPLGKDEKPRLYGLRSLEATRLAAGLSIGKSCEQGG